jgi:DNA replication protein DnaC
VKNAFEVYTDRIATKANKAIQIDERDFVKDGLIHCYRCGTPKQAKVPFINKPVSALCKCEREREEAVRFQNKVNELRNECIKEKNLHSFTFANDDGKSPELMKSAKEYVENYDEWGKKQGKGLLFHGGVGCGKTYAAVCVANALIDKGISCLVTDFPSIGRAIVRDFSNSQGILDRINAHSVIVIDDFGVERKTEFAQEVVYGVIDKRLKSGKPMIITTNLCRDDFFNPKSTEERRIYSRLFESCIPIVCRGEDRRIEEGRQTSMKFKQPSKGES